MACEQAVMEQEGKYLEALQQAERFRIEGDTLLVYARGLEQPLRFTRADPSAGARRAENTPDVDSGSNSAAAPRVEAWRVTGTEPFWALEIDSTGLRFITPDDMTGTRWPPLNPVVNGDTLRWIAETGRARVEASIWRGNCSDGMSDRVWPYTAAVRVDSTSYQGCAAPR
jgi:uncharacterized membrane protein